MRKMDRQFVHLSEFTEQAEAVGKRHGKLVILKVKSGDMHRDGIVFYKSVSGVWLTDNVPVKYLEVME